MAVLEPASSFKWLEFFELKLDNGRPQVSRTLM